MSEMTPQRPQEEFVKPCARRSTVLLDDDVNHGSIERRIACGCGSVAVPNDALVDDTVQNHRGLRCACFDFGTNC